MQVDPAIAELDRHWYPGFAANWDDMELRQRVLGFLEPTMSLLDLGAGAGIVRQIDFRSRAARVCGVDLDPRVLENPLLSQARVGSAEMIPYADQEFDCVIADNLLEHLEHPEAVFREISRVLRPGGRFFAKTPNKWHYMPLVARLTPLSFHRYFNRRRGRESEDTFPTLYRANSRRAIRRLASQAGLAVERIELIEGRPEYLRLRRTSYLMGYAYERLVNSSRWLECLRIVMIAELSRPATTAGSACAE